jgi:nicotinamidase-related amidase
MALTTIDPVPALVAIDLQQGIVSGRDPLLAAVVAQAAQLAAAFRRYDLPVVLVTVTGSAPGRRQVGRRGGGDPSSAQWAEIVDELKVQPTDHLITKRRYSAFHDTGLSTLLRDLGVTQVVVAGVTTSSAIESSARSAADYGFNVVVATDAVYDPDAEAHRHSVQRIFPKIGETATAAEVISMLEATR